MEVTSGEARIEHVTVYSRGARVRRVATISNPPAKLRITGLPIAVMDDTVRVEIEGPAIATTVRAGVDAPAEAAAPEDTPTLRAAKRRVALAETDLARLEAALDRLQSASCIAEDPSEEPPAEWAAVVAARHRLTRLTAERELALQTNVAAARRELDQAHRGLAAITDREAREGSAKPAKQHEMRKYVDVELAGSPSGASLAPGTARAEHSPVDPSRSVSGPITLHLEYLVDAARWAPSYVARIDGDRVALELRAVVAQDTGEDWGSVPLKLSTAEPTRFATLPELAMQRIGRRQQEPARAGFRAPPSGADTLYADYDRELVPQRKRSEAEQASKHALAKNDLRRSPVPHAKVPPRDEPAPPREQTFERPETFKQEVWDEDSSAAKEAFSTPARGVPMPIIAAAPAPQQQARQELARKSLRARTAVERPRGEMSGGGAAANDATPLVIEPPIPTVLLDYGNLVMAPPSSPVRGRLVPAEDAYRHSIAALVAQGRARIAGLALPRGYREEWSHAYDYAFATDGAVDIRADGGWHSIAVTGLATTAKLHHVAVPREQADVFRVATFANPFAGPLLPAPIDVYDRGRFLVTSSVEYTPPSAPVDVGLGVDPAVKIARNSEFHEEAAGMLRGALKLVHVIVVEIENVSGRAVELEVRERLPVTRDGDDDIEVVPGKVEPAWERWAPDATSPHDRLRGGYRWQLSIPAGQKRTLRAGYEVKIPAKAELVGGNRRES